MDFATWWMKIGRTGMQLTTITASQVMYGVSVLFLNYVLVHNITLGPGPAAFTGYVFPIKEKQKTV